MKDLERGFVRHGNMIYPPFREIPGGLQLSVGARIDSPTGQFYADIAEHFRQNISYVVDEDTFRNVTWDPTDTFADGIPCG